MKYDAVIIGSGPNGLSAAIELAEQGKKVLIVEGYSEIGGGMRTAELTLPGFLHDYCSAVHPMAALSPFFQNRPFDKYGLEWIAPPYAVAHPLDGQEAVILQADLAHTLKSIGEDGEDWVNWIKPFIPYASDIMSDVFSPPFHIPKNMAAFTRFGIQGIRSASSLAKSKFRSTRAQALFAGLAAHSTIPLDMNGSAAIGMVFVLSAHTSVWPIPKGGSRMIAHAMGDYFLSLGGEIQTRIKIEKYKDLPLADYYFFDTDPVQLEKIAGEELPHSYRKKLLKYKYGPGVFKIDWALNEEIPWIDKNCTKASTIHLGGTLEEIAVGEKLAWQGRICEKPYVLVCQQSIFDPTRAPMGKQTAYAYCHVPNASTFDYTEIMENQMERFAPGFKDIILAKKITQPKDFYAYNPNFLGGAITGGAATLKQVLGRPTLRINPYATPNKKIWICSASTPPGGGVHGMCGVNSVSSIIKKQKQQ